MSIYFNFIQLKSLLVIKHQVYMYIYIYKFIKLYNIVCINNFQFYNNIWQNVSM